MYITAVTPTPNLQHSMAFYEKLGYTKVFEGESVFFTDGNIVIEINPDRYTRAGLKLYKDSFVAEIEQLEKLTTVMGNGKIHSFQEPGGSVVYLQEGDPPFDPTSVTKQPAIVGNYMGVGFEVHNTTIAIKIWEVLGFNITMGSAEQGWLIMKNTEGFGLSLMLPHKCPHLFFNPSFSFFNGIENEQVIKKIIEIGIPIAEEITYFNKEGIVDNIIIRDPGGFGFFIFSD